MVLVIYLGVDMKVGEFMTRNVVTLSPDTSVEDALSKLAGRGISGAPVVEDGEIVGMVTESDFLKFFQENLSSRLIDRELSSTFDTLTALDDIASSQKSFPTGKIKKFLSTEVRELMTRDVFCVSKDDSLAKVSEAMSDRDINHIPVVNDELEGIVTRRDVIVGMSQG